jgi:hypothetical protein
VVAALVGVPVAAAVILALVLSSGGQSHAKLGSGTLANGSTPSRVSPDTQPSKETRPQPDTLAEVCGTWKGTITFKDQPREITVKLKKDGDNLAGAIAFRNGRDMPLEDVRYQDQQLSFRLVREGKEGRKFIMKYDATVTGDSMKGKAEFNNTVQHPWEATRTRD